MERQDGLLLFRRERLVLPQDVGDVGADVHVVAARGQELGRMSNVRRIEQTEQAHVVEGLEKFNVTLGDVRPSLLQPLDLHHVEGAVDCHERVEVVELLEVLQG